MSTRAYLNSNVHKSKKYYQDDNPHFEFFAGERIQSDKVGPYVQVDDRINTLPDYFEGVVAMITFSEELPTRAHREAGEYSHGTASAVLKNHSDGSPLFIEGKKLEDIRQLERLILTGKIRPKVSYEEPQMGPTYADLKAELEETKKKLLTLQAELYHKDGRSQ